MKIHYFQRYQQHENVATANAMLLLSRLYNYSADKFYQLLKVNFFSSSIEPEIGFNLQVKSKNGNSVPDAVISQESFSIIVETKIGDWYYEDQLMRHLKSFGDTNNKILLTLSTELMNEQKKKCFEERLRSFNSQNVSKIQHINMTFEGLAKAIQDLLDDRDYEMQDILDDYIECCIEDKLIANYDSWKILRVQLANATFDFNIREDLYFDNIDRKFRKHKYLGLYKEKSVKAIGEVTTIVTAVKDENGDIVFDCEMGEFTDEKKNKILSAMSEWNLSHERYFFVDKFYSTDFKKTSLRAPMGSRVFDLSYVLGLNKQDPLSVIEIADKLETKTWE